MSQTFTYTRVHNLGQLHTEIEAAAIAGMASILNADGEREAVYSLAGRESDNHIQFIVPDGVVRTDVDTVVNAHVADPNYGLEPRITEDDVMSMSDADLRRFLARRLLDA